MDATEKLSVSNRFTIVFVRIFKEVVCEVITYFNYWFCGFPDMATVQ
jgi:hypothetical protein